MEDRYCNSKIFSHEEVKEVANADYNLANTNQHLNTSKSNKTNLEYIWSKFIKGEPVDPTITYNMLKMQAQSEIMIPTALIGNKTVKITSTLLPSAKDSLVKANEYTINGINAGVDIALVTLTVSSINNIVSVASGEKEINEATTEITQVTGSSFLSGAGLELVQNGIIDVAKKTGSKDILKFASKGLPIAQISTSIMVGNSIIKYLNDELSEEECALEILMDGTGLVAYAIGMALGGTAGAVVSSVVCAQICKTIIAYKNSNKLTQQKLSRVNSIATEALIEMEYQRNVLKKLLDDQLLQWDNQFNLGFEEIFKATISNDINGLANGLDRILKVFGECVRFKTVEEFDEFFMDENAVLKL